MAASDSVASNLYAEPVVSEQDRIVRTSLLRVILLFAELSADFTICFAGLLTSCFVCASPSVGALAGGHFYHMAIMSVIFGGLVIFFSYREGAYHASSGLLRIKETERAIRYPTQSLCLLITASVLLHLDLTIRAFALALVIVPCLLMIEKQIFACAVGIARRKDRSCDRVVLYGAGESGRNIVSRLIQSPRLGFEPVAVIDDEPARSGVCLLEMGYRRLRSIAVHRGPVTPALLEFCRGNLLMIAAGDLSPERVADASRAASQAGLKVVPLYGPGTQGGDSDRYIDMDGLLIASRTTMSASICYLVVKRALDVALSILLLAILAPLFLIIAIWIRLDSPGPAFFAQRRVGRNGSIFRMYKFRSMCFDAAGYDRSPISSRDPRITRVGRFLRRTSLDELPQLVNVIIGNMSLVGPRPEMPFVVEQYNSDQRKRLQVTPGITGLWQLSADRAFPIHENLHYDLYYIRNRSLTMDLAILIHTWFFAFNGGI